MPAAEQPDDRHLDSAVRRRGSRFALWVAAVIGGLTVIALAIYSSGLVP